MKTERNLRRLRFSAYVKFLMRSTNHHGIHSPFVFRLVTRCFYHQEKHPAFNLLARYQKDWISSLNGLGTDSNSEDPKASYPGALEPVWKMDMKEARLLNRMVRYLKCRRILQLGGASGFKTAALSVMNQVEVLSVQLNPSTAELSQKLLASWNIPKVKVKLSQVEDELNQLAARNPKPFDLVFLDASIEDHRFLQVFELLLPLVHNDTAIIVEGIHRSGKMEKVWEELCGQPEVRVSIDIFRWGIVFFRREQAKEHFTVRL